jgi:hypothetical protein
MLARFEQLGLIERYAYEVGGRTETLQFANWREVAPVDPTSAERKRRYRQRLYGSSYYGTKGELMEVLPFGRAENEGGS